MLFLLGVLWLGKSVPQVISIDMKLISTKRWERGQREYASSALRLSDHRTVISLDTSSVFRWEDKERQQKMGTVRYTEAIQVRGADVSLVSYRQYCYEMRVIQAFSWMIFGLCEPLLFWYLPRSLPLSCRFLRAPHGPSQSC
jgi:hypothetical protein